MKQGYFNIIENAPISKGIYRMKLAGDSSAVTRPGQFINIRLDGFFLRRPISVCDWDESSLVIIYKVLGKGTDQMSAMKTGGRLDILTGLGNGFDTSLSGRAPLLIGGGVGTPPLYALAKALVNEDKKVTAALGFNTAEEAFYLDEFASLGVKVLTATADGTLGKRGFVTDLIAEVEHSYYFTCGPEAMLKAVWKTDPGSGQLSFEERMGCGFGACMGCTCKTVTGYKRICRDGPVLRKEEILWND